MTEISNMYIKKVKIMEITPLKGGWKKWAKLNLDDYIQNNNIFSWECVCVYEIKH